ncbi:P-loop containing nucleoside triphosphate hydrolase protein [Piromyces finnis]|uniref:p-loop containing nucleoside triphosphate hydrolase protein n=1 Tax=Piromyces finnis TaxID=1754191 RepID=A0A1Y1VCW1_9FUNG|nr:P-loop containing nucleoside triphosphate hydrolase protein [Piromyces finnis]|eukprot:ORX52518.1 P-loop containing nucleoside triphosphate hydrolase protein [Piromyces finnis]
MFFKKKQIPIPEQPQQSPYEKANFFSKLTFSWENPIFYVGYNRPLEKNDLYLLPNNLQENYNEKKFYSHWNKAIEKDGQANVTRTLIKVYGPKWFPAGIFKLLSDICNLISPVILELLLNHLDNKNARNNETYKGWIYIVLIFVLQILATLFINTYFKNTMEVGLSVRATIIGIIYRKTLKLSNKAKQTIGDGQIINLVSTDSARIQFLLGNLHYIWSGPFQLVVILVLLIRSLGAWSLIGFTIFLVVIPLQGYIMKLLARLRKQTAILTDQRVKRTQEIIGSMRVIKFFGWEKSFLDILTFLRKKELKRTKKSVILSAETSAIFNVIPFFSCALTFIAYSAAGNRLTAAKVFSSLAFFNMLRFPLAILPNVFSNLMDAKVAMKRLSNLLNAKELDDLPEIDVTSDNAISIKDGQFNWESVKSDVNNKNSKSKDKISKEKNKKAKTNQGSSSASALINNKSTEDITNANLKKNVQETDSEEENSADSFKLHDINIKIKKNSLTAIVGTVGSGKSSLINAIIGEMKREEGKITLGGTISYCSQQAWIQNATVRENILFGKEYNEEFYNKVIDICALTHDLEIFPDGDMTEIGERGINLSGGQKQRVNLARAVYFNSDIILMDDPLSAVDAHVSRALFDNCILGALSNKTRVLVTHQLHVLPKVDYIIVMNNGRIEEQGEYEELMQKEGEFARLMHTYGGIDENEEESTESIPEETKKEKETIKNKEVKKEEKKTGKALMTKEERATGSVKLSVYKSYAKAAGGVICAFIIIFIVILIQLAKLGNDVWLVKWTEGYKDLKTSTYILVYLLWNIGQTLLTLLYSIYLAFVGIKAASRVHKDAISRVIMAPISFFDTTPLGRIINRFSKDQDSLDNSLFVTMQMLFTNLGNTVTTLVFMLYVAPIFGVALVPLLLIYYFVQQFYRSTSRELKRIDSITRSPLYANLTETMQGLPTIRAYSEQERFIKYNQLLIDENNRPQHLQITAQRWLGLRLESIGAFLVLFDGISGLLLKNNISSSLLGLSLSYSLQVTSSLNAVVRQFSDTEVHMNAAERLLYYANEIEVENQKGLDAPKDWPKQGKIEIKDLTMKYAPHLPPVLHHVSLDIQSNEKIGVVGRTGAGKSSIVMTLFRLVEPEVGSSLKIDDISIMDLKLSDLRQRISIIPQDPILFSGTIRFNMDPFNEHTDEEIWEALENAGLKPTISELENKLESDVRANGENFSVGQRQLLCLARAMIRNSPILIMDEATASVDIETDAIIQKALRTKFSNVTVLTIAHRLNTIIDYDKILVLSKGEVLEFDSPKNLLFETNENGELVPCTSTEFSKLVDETGPVNAALLRQLAFESENKNI